MGFGLLAVLLAAALRGLWLLHGYLSGASAFPQPLPPEEEREALAALRRGDAGARNRLVEHNLRLVAHIVKKFEGCGEDPEDLISIGTVGLIKGVETFQPDRGTRLATYAARCIENEIRASAGRGNFCQGPRRRPAGRPPRPRGDLQPPQAAGAPAAGAAARAGGRTRGRPGEPPRRPWRPNPPTGRCGGAVVGTPRQEPSACRWRRTAAARAPHAAPAGRRRPRGRPVPGAPPDGGRRRWPPATVRPPRGGRCSGPA